VPQWLTDIPADFWMVLGEMAPYLLLGFFVAGVLSVVMSPEFVERHLGGRGLWTVFKASAFGVPLPLCSCGVIPVAASIRRHGAGRGATTAFLISTPQTGVDSILATLSLLGPVYAIYRPIAALVSGLLGGAVGAATDEGDGNGGDEAPAQCNAACCSGSDEHGKAYRALTYGFVTLPRDIAKTLLIGLALAALISALVPEGYFSGVVPPGPLQILVLMLAGIPIYICATASIPIAVGLIQAGVSPGAVFALLMTGPATNAAAVATVWKVLGRRTCLIYLAAMMVGAFVGGIVLDQIVTAQEVGEAMHHGWLPGPVKSVSAVALLAMLVSGWLYRPGGGHDHDHEHDETCDHDHAGEAGEHAHEHVAESAVVTITVKGMTCSHCTNSVRRALLECEGVSDVTVDLASGRAEATGDDPDPDVLREAVESLGFEVAATAS